MHSTVVSWVSAHGHIFSLFQPTWALTWDINHIHLYGSSYTHMYIDSLNFGTWALTWEWALAVDTTVQVLYTKYIASSLDIASPQ